MSNHKPYLEAIHWPMRMDCLWAKFAKPAAGVKNPEGWSFSCVVTGEASIRQVMVSRQTSDLAAIRACAVVIVKHVPDEHLVKEPKLPVWC